MPSYEDFKNFYNDFKNDKITMIFVRILSGGIVAAFIVISIAAWIRGCNDKPVHYLWGAYDSNPKDTVKQIVDTCINKASAIIPNKTGEKKSAFFRKPNKPNAEAKGNTMNVDSGGSGIQNNAPNYGNQAGRDMYVNQPKEPTKEMINFIESQIPDKTSPIQLRQGTTNTGNLKFCEKLKIKLEDFGYKNVIVYDIGQRIGLFPEDEIHVVNSNGTYLIYVNESSL